MQPATLTGIAGKPSSAGHMVFGSLDAGVDLRGWRRGARRGWRTAPGVATLPAMADEKTTQEAETKTRAEESWTAIAAAYKDAEARSKQSWAEIEAAHREAAKRAGESWAAIDAGTRKA